MSITYQKAPLENPPGGTLRPPFPPASTIGPCGPMAFVYVSVSASFFSSTATGFSGCSGTSSLGSSVLGTTCSVVSSLTSGLGVNKSGVCYICGRPGPLIWLGWGCRCQVLFWSKADTGLTSGRCQHLAAALCTGVQPRVHHRRVGSHRKPLVLFQIQSGRWRRHKKDAEASSQSSSSSGSALPRSILPDWRKLQCKAQHRHQPGKSPPALSALALLSRQPAI